jgi:hypothetical protein
LRPLRSSFFILHSPFLLRAIVWTILLTTASLHAQISREYALKAAFLYNFAQFVEWPAEAFPEADSAFVIGVLGEDPFGSVLNDTVSGEAVRGHRFKVERYRRVEDALACHILFISQSEERRLERILGALKDRPILTVGDFEGFALRGGMIRFITEGNKIRLRINPAPAKEAKLTISSKLLRVAKEVVGADGAPTKRETE